MQRLKKAYRRPSLAPRHDVLAVAVDHGELAALAEAGGGAAPSRVGVLLKYTNVVKGWKRRMFSLQNGVLEYGSAGGDDDDRPADRRDGPGHAGGAGPELSKRHNSAKRYRSRLRAKRRLLRRYGSKEEKERDIKGRINLQFAAITADDSDGLRFAIDVGYDVFHCKADSTSERDAWVAILKDSNDYFRGLITNAAKRARDRPTPPEPREKSEESDDSVMEDDGLLEAEQSRKALMVELKHVSESLRKAWLSDKAAVTVANESELVKTLMDAFSVQQGKKQEMVGETAKQLLDLVAWSLQVLTTNDEMYDRRLKADLARMMGRAVPVFPVAPSETPRVYCEGEYSDSETDSELQFFDALSRSASISSHSPVVMPIAPPAEAPQSDEVGDAVKVPSSAATGEQPQKEEHNQTAPKLSRILTNMLGPETSSREARSRLPPIGPREKMNIWSIVKDSVGKDLSKISIPVVINEPLSFVQRLAEDVEYSELLDKAADSPDPHERLMYVAAAVVSHYSSTLGRVNKPFNPLLGETFELVLPSKGKGLRFVSEQVSHHPPISACHAEGAGGSWKYYNAMEIKNKFWGKSLEIFPTGLNHVEIPEYDDHFVFEQVTTCVHNIVVGRMWLDNYGEIVIDNRRTGDRCTLTFNKTGWMSDSRSFASIKGIITDKSGRERIRLGGNWNERVYRDHGKGKHETIWTVAERPPASASNGYNWTKWAITLNEAVPDELRILVAPSDSRFRPDQRALENGNNAEASKFKTLLEQGQRDRRKIREEQGLKWAPLWFDRVVDDVTGKVYYKFNGKYFEAKANQDWSASPDLFSCAVDVQTPLASAHSSSSNGGATSRRT